MNQTEYINALKQIPEETRKQYKFMEPFDFSPYKCIHTNDYDYYPELDCCIINERIIIWTKNNPWVTPENPEILAGFKKRITHTEPKIRRIEKNQDNTISCYESPKHEPFLSYMQRKNQTACMHIDNTDTYYNPNEIDLPNRPDLQTIAKCLFYAKKHPTISLIPDKTKPVEEWTPVQFK